jgi:2-oxoisovalerate dehydrogenase E2 component (dihydrolipoyl transacylase)
MNLSISCDHRVVDGSDAARYVQALKKYLETPVLLFAQ